MCLIKNVQLNKINKKNLFDTLTPQFHQTLIIGIIRVAKILLFVVSTCFFSIQVLASSTEENCTKQNPLDTPVIFEMDESK
jgi:hypothetical protein